MRSTASLRLGDIDFLNSWPVTYALRKGIVSTDIRMVHGTPAELNRRLLTGELDASAVSSLAYLRHSDEFVPIPDLCIRSDQTVHSVIVVSRQPLTTLKGRTIGVSNQGATTPILLKLVAARRNLKINLEVTHLRYPEILEEYPAALLIGDEALSASQSSDNLQWWDLGEAWTSWTKKPFVYALWVVRRQLVDRQPEVLSRLQEILMSSYEWSGSHEEELVAAMREEFPFEVNFLKQYLKAISYDLDAKAWEGLVRFAKEAEAAGELARGTVRRLRKPASSVCAEVLSAIRHESWRSGSVLLSGGEAR